jgi:hypothetical protein
LEDVCQYRVWKDFLNDKLGMKTLKVFLFIIAVSFANPITAQDSQTIVTYDLTAETAVGSGDFTAYQLSTNRYHTLASRSNTAYLRGAVNIEHQWAADWKLSASVDAIASIHADNKAYLQQCYVNLSWKDFFVEAGARELKPVLRDPLLSSGAFAKGNNAKPVPQVHVGTNGFWTVPYTKGWLHLKGHIAYGMQTDDKWQQDFTHQQSRYTKHSLYHS